MKNTRVSRRVGVLTSALCLLVASPALAQELNGTPNSEPSEPAESAERSESEAALDKKRASARQLATDASSDYRMGRFQDAYDSFNRAFRLVGVPALGVWSARSLRQMNRLVEASERYREVLKLGAPVDSEESHETALRDAQAELDELVPLIPNLKITLSNANVEDVAVTMDGEAVDSALVGAKQRINPGKHEIVATRGTEIVKQEVELALRANEEVVLEFKPGYKKFAAPLERKGDAAVIQQGFTTRETIGIVAMSGAGALLITGVVTTILGLGQQEELRKNCPNSECLPEFHSDVNKFDSMKVVSAATLVGAGILGGIGAVLYFGGSEKANADQGEMALYVDGPNVGMKGSF